AEPEFFSNSLDVLHHVLNGVALLVLALLRSAGATLIYKDQLIGACERQQVGQEVVVRSAGAAMQDQQRIALANGLVIDHQAVRVDVAFLLGIDVRRDSFGGGLGTLRTTMNRAALLGE